MDQSIRRSRKSVISSKVITNLTVLGADNNTGPFSNFAAYKEYGSSLSTFSSCPSLLPSRPSEYSKKVENFNSDVSYDSKTF